MTECNCHGSGRHQRWCAAMEPQGAALPTDPFELVRSIIHECPALKLPQTFLQKIGMTAQIVPLKGLTQAQAQAIVDRLNAAAIPVNEGKAGDDGGKGEAPAQRMTEAEIHAHSWWCPHCKAAVPPEMVTKDGEHYLESGGCGRPVRGERNDGVKACEKCAAGVSSMPESYCPVCDHDVTQPCKRARCPFAAGVDLPDGGQR